MMKRTLIRWPIRKLKEQFHTIEYPEFQREPTVWSSRQKQLLIDSILRSFDIGSIYLVQNEENQYQCVDGRQRLNALFSFLGLNNDSKDNFFQFKASNEVKEDPRFTDADGSRFDEPRFENYRDAFLHYRVNVVLLSEVLDDDDLNLQFQRLQVAQILNAGEKLNAMVGQMRDVIFDPETGLGMLPYFAKLKTRSGRFGNQQSASQVLLNAISYAEKREFNRARFIDLQVFFKDNFKISPERNRVIEEIRESADDIVRILNETTLKRVKNRALAVSILLFYFIHKHVTKKYSEKDYKEFDEFLATVIDRLQEIAKKPISDQPNIWERLQLAITQGSVEKSAFERRHDILTNEFSKYLE